MFKTIYSITIIFLGIFLTSCEKDANVKLPYEESKLVVISLISPQDSIVKVDVSLSQPLYNNSNSGIYSKVIDATVQISDGVNKKQLSFDSFNNCYFIHRSQYSIIAGKTYYLSVSTPDGKIANASTSIPSLNTSLTFSTKIFIEPNYQESHTIEASWQDTPGTEDFYRCIYYHKNSWENPGGGTNTSYYKAFSQDISDEEKDGEMLNSNGTIYSDGEIWLLHASKDYYLYHSKLFDTGNSGNDPFSEPILMYSNIDGGYGIFGGYNQFKLDVVL